MSDAEKAVHRNDATRQSGNTGGKRADQHRKGVTEQGKPRSYD